jgi:hypothetical protein
MKIPHLILAIAITLLVPKLAYAAGLPPWQFGMTKEQVAGFKQFGPYKSFKNGDLETYNGKFHGHKENVQFFFRNGRLVRIGVYLYEGENKEKAAKMFARVYALLERDYGKVLVPAIHVAKGSEPVTVEILGIAAMGNSVVTGRTEMTPVKQPRDMRVFARVMHPIAQPGDFAVAIFIDPPGGADQF